ncbi:MAG: HAD family phosphatase [Acidobacteria bacterium]|nr:HAD family phosphatase [Acidobacteriota bacterium]
MLKAIIFDFNGVILNDEPLHFKAMQEAVAELGITLTEAAYWDKYLPLDDNECLDAICLDHAVRLNEENRNRILQIKSASYNSRLENRFPIFPGAAQFIASAALHYPLALASGATREEIENSLEATGLKQHFLVIVAAEDFSLGKPHPESFLLALKKLNTAIARKSFSIMPEECLVIEDSVGGVAGARAAGMRCLAVSNSYPPEKLKEANRVVDSLEEVHVDSLPALFDNPA